PEDHAIIRLKERLGSIEMDQISSIRDIHLREIVMYARRIREIIEILLHASTQQDSKENYPYLQRCRSLATDLELALTWVDSVERLRTTFVYVYALWDDIFQLVKERNMYEQPVNVLSDTAGMADILHKLLTVYASIALN